MWQCSQRTASYGCWLSHLQAVVDGCSNSSKNCCHHDRVLKSNTSHGRNVSDLLACKRCSHPTTSLQNCSEGCASGSEPTTSTIAGGLKGDDREQEQALADTYFTEVTISILSSGQCRVQCASAQYLTSEGGAALQVWLRCRVARGCPQELPAIIGRAATLEGRKHEHMCLRQRRELT